MLVIAEVSVVNASAGRGGRSMRKRLTNSAAMCCASAALPPLPKIISLLPRRNASAIAWIAAVRVSRVHAEAVDEFGGDVLRVGAAAAVAENHQLVAAEERLGDRVDRRDESIEVLLEKRFLGLDALIEGLDDRLLHADFL